MSWRTTIIFFALSVSTLFGIMHHYKVDFSLLGTLSFYQNLANPSMRMVYIQEGLRKEQIAEIMAEKLDWDEKEKRMFINAHLALDTDNLEGKYFPKTYLLYKDEDPMGVTAAMLKQFSKETSKVRKQKRMEVIKEDTALKIASIIQREAGGKSDMKLISGIIWNRLWAGMKLQMDATLQYAKGNEEDGWWSQVDSSDKKINSPYNTYKEEGLPPSPIANPGLAAIEAAYNPQKTSCIFYLHDKNRKIHCAKTYEEHKKNIEKYL
jgi:UPF0755 protein